MTRTLAVIIAAIVLLVLDTAPPAAAQNAQGAERKRSAATEFSAQSRARTRMRVTPAYPHRTFSTDYPVPYKYAYPGPGYVRQCTSWLAPENRLSGAVIVPKMQCWWQPG